jgi:hypothetical protein
MPTRRVGLLAVWSVVWTATPATADVIYKYTGHPFTTATSPFMTSDFVSGTIEVLSVLPPNLNESPIQVTAFSFSDGVQTLTSARLPVPTESLVSTDASGAIAGFWEFVFGGNPDAPVIQTLNGVLGTQGAITQDEGRLGNLAIGESIGLNSNDPGIWMLVPEPSTMVLVGVSIVGVAVGRRGTRAAWLG